MPVLKVRRLQPTDAWHFAVTPHLWMAGLNGNTRIGPLTEQNVDAPFSDVVGNLSAAFMGLFEAHKNRWGILLDTFYVILSQTSGPLLGGELGTVKLKLDQTILGLGGTHRVMEREDSFVDVGLGVRYVNLDAHLGFSQSSLLLSGLTHSEVSIGRSALWPFGARMTSLPGGRYTVMPT